MRLLLHACCGPCSLGCIAALAEEGQRPDLFWYNPNIHPVMEYRARRDTLVSCAEEEGLSLIMEDRYGLRDFLRGLSTYNDYDDAARCPFCYRMRLEETAARAAALGYEAFSTTLLISPYQKHEIIRETGERLAARYGLAFLYRDFRPRFREGRKIARERQYYLQKYCGCIFSEEERYLAKREHAH